MDLYNCTTPFGTNLDNICHDPEKGKNATKLYFRFMRKEFANMSRCAYPCQQIYARILGKNYVNDTKVVTLRFDKMIKSTQARRPYGFLEMIAEFGGYVGMFLGFSFLDIGHILTKFYQP